MERLRRVLRPRACTSTASASRRSRHRWHSGRVTLVGVAGYGLGPFSSMGTSTTFYGAYVLAGEVIGALGDKDDGDAPTALGRYMRTMHP
jgi:2-polyprenyl-6-methoxyphenol hydroxylase-like FAD-dependent oxidoreductase